MKEEAILVRGPCNPNTLAVTGSSRHISVTNSWMWYVRAPLSSILAWGLFEPPHLERVRGASMLLEIRTLTHYRVTRFPWGPPSSRGKARG